MQLPWEYAPPLGRLFLAQWDGAAVGCIALRPLGSTRCEMRRLYVRPAFRSAGVGRRLVTHLIQEARKLGYGEMLLTTLSVMAHALGLYRTMGFREMPPYVDHPQDGVIYMASML